MLPFLVGLYRYRTGKLTAAAVFADEPEAKRYAATLALDTEGVCSVYLYNRKDKTLLFNSSDTDTLTRWKSFREATVYDPIEDDDPLLWEVCNLSEGEIVKAVEEQAGDV